MQTTKTYIAPYLCPSCSVYVPYGESHTCCSSPAITYASYAPDMQTQQKLDEILRLIRQRKNRQCSVCGQEKHCWTDMPYGSFYDGEIVCGDCCAKYLDPILDLIRVAKGNATEE